MLKPAFPLTMVSPGREVILVSVEGGWRLRRRLTDMGLNEGMKFKVLQSHRPGLGYGMANRVLVQPVRDKE